MTKNNQQPQQQQQPYPVRFHEPREGYSTAKVHSEFCQQNPNVRPVDTSNEYNLTAGDDPHDALHFWQLYSILGEKPIVDIVTQFYTRVFADDEEPWFRDAFVRIAPLDHHIATQAAYWLDCMGGGPQYHGGEFRLRFHHTHNAEAVMTARGATRWMYHMRHVLENIKFDDARVKPCILDFLRSKMMRYSEQFGWTFNEKEMELYQD